MTLLPKKKKIICNTSQPLFTPVSGKVKLVVLQKNKGEIGITVSSPPVGELRLKNLYLYV